ncbi:thermonuclease family protein [Rhodococcus sp. 11-3]|uniref:thermonuclease family protein n=1 Tax=Rhodococcus sp. 11-3 TaxID=2854796 RepID=UPI00204030BC|nr:thermonuclease family protein [Rhodococcus sp. 11-3]USC16244.1 thermonuclease family protein [Rhodococcus sp. 11-3]
MKTHIIAATATAAAAAALATLAAAPASAGPAEPYKIPGVTQVVDVLDGDTIVTRHPDSGETLTISVLGMDAPEGSDCWSVQSTDFARTALLGIAVQLSPEPGQPNADGAGHLLRYVALDNDMDGDYAVKAVRNGAGRAYTVGSLRTADRLVTAENEARTNRAGLWTCGGAPAPAPAPAPAAPAAPAPAPAPKSAPNGNVVHPGAFCSGGTGVTSKGTPMVCAPGSDGRNRWQSAN